MEKQDELTPEQSEAQAQAEKRAEEEATKAERAHAIRCGMALKRIKSNPDFKLLFDELYIKDGKDILWQNIRHLTEAQMMGRGSDKNQEVINVLTNKVKSRLDLESFMNTIEHDEESVHEQEEQERLIALEQEKEKLEAERLAELDKRGE